MHSTVNGTDKRRNRQGALPEGTVLKDRYKLEKVLGRGGFGITYRAFDRNVQVEVAVKEYLAKSGEEAERAVREARIAASLYELDGIVAVRDYFKENGTAYIVMEYVRGVSVKQYITKHGRMNGQEVLKGIAPLMKSIQKIHEKGILHRDISADNLMITKDGKWKLIDFGAAGFVDPKREEHTILIKRGFVPVEQYRAEEKLGPWTDVYSLCAVIYFMISGMVPEDAMERWINDRMIRLEDIYGTGLSVVQSQEIMKGLAVRKEERYQSVEELYRDLYGVRNGITEKAESQEEVTSAGEPGHTETLRREVAAFLAGDKRKKNHKIQWIITAVVIIGLAAGIWSCHKRENPEKKLSEPGITATIKPANTTDAEKNAESTPDTVKMTKTPEKTKIPEKTKTDKKSQTPKRQVKQQGEKKDSKKREKVTKAPAAVTPEIVQRRNDKETPTPKSKAAKGKATEKKKQEFDGNLDELMQ